MNIRREKMQRVSVTYQTVGALADRWIFAHLDQLKVFGSLSKRNKNLRQITVYGTVEWWGCLSSLPRAADGNISSQEMLFLKKTSCYGAADISCCPTVGQGFLLNLYLNVSWDLELHQLLCELTEPWPEGTLGQGCCWTVLTACQALLLWASAWNLSRRLFLSASAACPGFSCAPEEQLQSGFVVWCKRTQEP